MLEVLCDVDVLFLAAELAGINIGQHPLSKNFIVGSQYNPGCSNEESHLVPHLLFKSKAVQLKFGNNRGALKGDTGFTGGINGDSQIHITAVRADVEKREAVRSVIKSELGQQGELLLESLWTDNHSCTLVDTSRRHDVRRVVKVIPSWHDMIGEILQPECVQKVKTSYIQANIPYCGRNSIYLRQVAFVRTMG